MNVSIGERWEAFVDGVVREGRYGAASELSARGSAWSRNGRLS
jgi:antitoxin ParD1/3/4